MKSAICEEVCEECPMYGEVGTDHCEDDAHRLAIQALEEIQQYRAIGTVEEMKELKKIIADFPLDCGSMISDVKEIYHQLTKYLKIGTIEEFKALKEKFENAKDDIRKLLSSEYGSSCQFCVHDENEDAMCCNIGGSGSWCCENARWKEH